MENYKATGQDGRTLKPRVRLHPGDVLKDELDARGLKKSAFAKMIGLSASQLSELLHAKRHVSEDLALRLETVLAIEAEYWMRVQTTYNLDKKRLEYAQAVQPLSTVQDEGVTYIKKEKKKK